MVLPSYAMNLSYRLSLKGEPEVLRITVVAAAVHREREERHGEEEGKREQRR